MKSDEAGDVLTAISQYTAAVTALKSGGTEGASEAAAAAPQLVAGVGPSEAWASLAEKGLIPPGTALLRPFWLMAVLRRSLAAGGWVSGRIYASPRVWRQVRATGALCFVFFRLLHPAALIVASPLSFCFAVHAVCVLALMLRWGLPGG